MVLKVKNLLNREIILNLSIFIVTHVLLLLHKDYKGVMEMKQKLGKAIMMVVLLMGMSQTAWAEDTVVPAEKTVATTETSSSEVVQESTESSSTNQTESVPESSISKEDVQTIENEVEALIRDQLGEKTGEEVPLDSDYPASYIRQALLENSEYGISQEALAKYTDSQLEDTMTLFQRYGFDISGMDFSSYVRLLNTLYVDKTVSIDKALAQLSFNPSNFNSFAEMIPQVAKLQQYLSALYPSNSSFMAGKEMSDDVLIATLTHLDGFERQIKEDGQTLGAGRMAYILNAEAYGMTTNTTPSTSDTKKADVPVASSDTKKADEKGGLLKLPQTGEEKAKWAVSILGVVLIILVVIYLVRRNKTNKSK